MPTGWPSAIAPPLGFNFSRGTPSFSIVYVAYDAKASLISKISISFTSRPAFYKATGIAKAGPIPITSGGTPAQAYDNILPCTLRPSFLAIDLLVSITQAAPSET